jgi:hypothetical protein
MYTLFLTWLLNYSSPCGHNARLWSSLLSKCFVWSIQQIGRRKTVIKMGGKYGLSNNSLRIWQWLCDFYGGTRWRSWLRHCATRPKTAGSIPDGVIDFFNDVILPAAQCSWGWHQECFLGVKAACAQGWPSYHLLVPIVLKSGSFNLLESSGPVQACNGIVSPLLFSVISTRRSTSLEGNFQVFCRII